MTGSSRSWSALAWAALFAPVGMAQAEVIVPAAYADLWGRTSSSVLPLDISFGRDLIVYSDGSAGTFDRVAFRPDPILPRGVAQEGQMQIWLGDADVNRRSLEFLANFVGLPTVVLARRPIQWPDYSQRPGSGPRAAFGPDIPFDQPWIYTAAFDLGFMREGWRPVSGVLGVDTVSNIDSRGGLKTVHGVGCYNTWNNEIATVDGAAVVERATATMQFSLQGTGFRPNSLTTHLLGATASVRAWPFLCASQYVGDVIFAHLATSDSRGRTGPVRWTIPHDAAWAGAVVHVQAYCLDDGRHPLLLPVTVSNGLSIELPVFPPAWVPSIRIEGTAGSTMASRIEEARIPVVRFQ